MEQNKLPEEMFFPCEYCSVASDGVCAFCDYKVTSEKISKMSGYDEGGSTAMMFDNYMRRISGR